MPLDMSLTLDGGIIVTGLYGEAIVADHLGSWAFYLDAEGRVGWQTVYFMRGIVEAFAVQQTEDARYLLAGTARTGDEEFQKGWVLELDADGSILWQRAYGAYGFFTIRHVIQEPRGGYVAAGQYMNPLTGVWDCWVMRLDANMDILWQRAYDMYDPEQSVSIQASGDGGYALASNGHPRGARVLALDDAGNTLWAKSYGDPLRDEAVGFQKTGDGGYVIAGFSDSDGETSRDMLVVKIDAAGDMVWQKQYGGPGSDEAADIRQTSDEGYIVVGASESFGLGPMNAWVVKLDAAGNISWQKTYGGPRFDRAYSVRETFDGGYAILATSSSFSSSDSVDLWVFKMDGTGDISPSCPEGIPSDSSAWTIESSLEQTDAEVTSRTTYASNLDLDMLSQDTSMLVSEQCSR